MGSTHASDNFEVTEKIGSVIYRRLLSNDILDTVTLRKLLLSYCSYFSKVTG